MPQTLRTALGTVFLAGALLLGGCSDRLMFQPTAPVSSSRATLVLQPQIATQGYRRAQAVVPSLTLDDVDHVRVQLTRMVPDGEVAVRDEAGPLVVRLERPNLDRPIILSQLNPHTHYRVRAWAYKAPDEFESNQISVDQALEVVVEDDDRPTMASLRIQLMDVPFNGKATIPSFEVLPGGYVADGPESIGMAPVEYLRTDLGAAWLGFDGDRMSQRAVAPDGAPDAHLRLSVDLPVGVTVQYLSVYAYDADEHYLPDQYWTTWDYEDPLDRMLGVAHDGQPLNTDFATQLGTFSGVTTFDLYAHGNGDFAAGRIYRIHVGLNNGTVLWNDVTIPVQQEAPTNG